MYSLNIRCLRTIQNGIFALSAGLFLLATVGCQSPKHEEVSGQEDAVIIVEVPTESPTPDRYRPPTLTAVPTTITSPTVSDITTAEATSSPTPTPITVVEVFTPPGWSFDLSKLIEELNSDDSPFLWKSTTEESSAEIVISQSSGSFTSGSQSLFLTVPFTADLDQISLAEAEDIILNGHPDVEVNSRSDIQPDRRALVINGFSPWDSSYPLQQSWFLNPREGLEEPALMLSDVLTDTLESEPIVHIVAVGDIMLDRALGNLIRRGQVDYPFELVEEQLEKADVAVGNFESSLGDSGKPADKSYTFQSPPESAQTLANAGFDLVSLANNHALDYGSESLIQGIELLKSVGVDSVGAGPDITTARSPVVVEVQGVSIAFLAYVDVPIEGSGFNTKSWAAGTDSPGLNWADSNTISQDVADANMLAEIVVVLLHSGYEYVEQPSPEQSAAAETAVDAGADLVIGHHSHLLQGIQYYNGGVIVYGLGNFAFEIDGDPSSALLNVWLDKSGVRQIDIEPAVVQRGGQPRLASPEEAERIRHRIYYLTDLLN